MQANSSVVGESFLVVFSTVLNSKIVVCLTVFQLTVAFPHYDVGSSLEFNFTCDHFGRKAVASFPLDSEQ